MKRSQPMKRTGRIKPRTAAEKRARTRRKKILGKPEVGVSAVWKGPARDLEHLMKVRMHNCLACDLASGTEAHHVRCIGPRTLGKRVSDYLTVPLCKFCHADLHRMNEAKFWAQPLIRMQPADFIRCFSPVGADELARLGIGERLT